MNQSKNMQIWMGINKDGFVSLHCEEPVRDGDKWKSIKPFCNSIIQNQFEDLAKRAQMTWESGCEVFELTF